MSGKISKKTSAIPAGRMSSRFVAKKPRLVKWPYCTFLRSVVSLKFWCCRALGNDCFCDCEWVIVMQAAVWHSGPLVLSFPSPQCSQKGKFCHTLICHTACYLSPLVVCLLICSLSSTGDVIHATEGEKEGSLSSAPERMLQTTAPPAGELRSKVHSKPTFIWTSAMDFYIIIKRTH